MEIKATNEDTVEKTVNGVINLEPEETTKLAIRNQTPRYQDTNEDVYALDIDKIIRERRKAKNKKIFIGICRFVLAYFIPFIILLVCLILPPISVGKIEFLNISSFTTYPDIYLLSVMVFVVELLIIYGWAKLYRLYLHILRLNKIIK